ncbi:5'-3' exoribonuclease 1 [Nymphon striatum]|nr:5'-3' exoribonuclease 1 [Nymphon striatum]
MGVPKFYRWISERYPCLSEVIKEYQIPEFDNLYFDMNGIIHVCSHPNDDDPHFRISEEKIFADIFHYIEVLFRMIKPKKVFFMAVDGVAPRAKMNQQRGRRFRSAREAKTLEEEAIRKGETLPSEARFDSNCITPGTEFMVRLQEELKFFVMSKISTDKLWQGLRIYLSGHETPGEGEHKIMDFIRYEKSCSTNYDPNTRHCLYGLDADLIMLGLCSHEPHFSLLREEVRFGGKRNQKRVSCVEQTTFHLLHLSLMREYLELEFQSVKDELKFQYNVENIIDDWVLMGFLVGNDFIPHLPNLHIAHDALPTLYKTYLEVLPNLDGYINEGGILNLARFEEFMKCLAKVDYEKFDDSYADLKWLEGKSCKRDKSDSLETRKVKNSNNPFSCLEKLCSNMDELKIDESSEEQDLIDLSSAFKNELTIPSDSESNDEEETFELEFQSMKRNYYMSKLEFEEVSPQVMEEQALGYVRAIQWNLHYYYNGVASWSWYYPHHYAPYISDIKCFSHNTLEYDYAAPFLPYEQLLAVLPSLSKDLLPKAYQKLMCSLDSPLIEFYPETFKTDLNGKQQDWEAVVLIPFLDENKLISAMKIYEPNLTKSERLRNMHGPCLLYTYSSNSHGSVESSLPNYFPDIAFNHAVLTEIDKEFFRLPSSSIKKGLCENALLDVYFPGFPTLKHIPFTEAEKIVDEVLGKIVYVSWPHLIEARIVAISTATHKYSLPNVNTSKSDKFEIEELGSNTHAFRTLTKECESKNLTRHGIEISDTRLVIHAQPITGRSYMFSSKGRVTLEKKWAECPQSYPFQTIVQDISVHNSTIKPYYSIEEIFPAKSTVFMLVHPHYGYRGEVVNIEKETKCKIRVKVFLTEEPDIGYILKQQKRLSDRYYPGYVVAKNVNRSSHLISRITGSMFIIPIMRQNHVENASENRINIGLNLKFNKKNEEVPGFTKRSEGTWLYSNQSIDLIDEYLKKFPDLWKRVSEKMNCDIFFLDDIFPDKDGREKLADVQKFLKELPSANIERQSCGSDVLDSGIVKAIEASVDKLNQKSSKSPKCADVLVKPKLVYKPSVDAVIFSPDINVELKLFDRVVNIRSGYSVPLGLRGTIIGIHKGLIAEDTVYDVLFDEKFNGGISIQGSSAKVYRMSAAALIDLTHGNRKNEQNLGSGNDVVRTPLNLSSNIVNQRTSKSYAQASGVGNRKSEYSSSKSNQYARINHSPTSPFQPQNTSVHHGTPKIPFKQHNVNARNSNNSSDGSPKSQSSELPFNDEFLEIWKSLKGTNLSSTPENKSKGNEISLEHAAKSLPKLNPSIPSPEKQSIDHHSYHQTNTQPNTMEKNMPSSPIINNSLDVESYNDKSSAVLRQLLHINDTKDDDRKNTPSEISDVKKAEIKVAEMQKPKSEKEANDTSNSVIQLLSYLQSKYEKIPVYTYHDAGAMVKAELRLPGGTTFHGSAGNRQKASEAAATEALKYLKSVEAMDTSENTVENYISVAIVDGMAELQCLDKPSWIQTGKQLSCHFIDELWKKYDQYDETHLIFDRYDEVAVSLKASTPGIQLYPQQVQNIPLYPSPMLVRPTLPHPQYTNMVPDMRFNQNYLRARITAPNRHFTPNNPVDVYRMNYEQQMRTAHAYHSNSANNSINSPVKSKTELPTKLSYIEESKTNQAQDSDRGSVISPDAASSNLGSNSRNSSDKSNLGIIEDSKKTIVQNSNNDSSLSPSANPFIPLQVTKHQTSKKNSPPRPEKEIKDTQSEETSLISNDENLEASTSEQNPEASTKKKNRSRLACGFQNPLH